MMAPKRFPRLLYNRITIIGVAISLVSLIVMTFLYLIDIYATETNPYFGIFLYMIMPVFLIGGMILIPIGMYFNWRRWKKTGEMQVPKWPLVDLNDKSQRNAAFIFIVGTIIFLGISAVGSYEAFHYSESVDFCGRLCHSVMKPEYTAYSHSPHARVACVACHVGPGADWYARSKLSGAYQVYATAADIYPRPIPTPIKNLRPAQETCEQCHWPEKFFGSRQVINDHYMYGDNNTHWPITMMMKIGGRNIRTGEATGIHWHVNPDVDVFYIPRDSTRQDIPWVKVINNVTGRETIYQNESDPLSPEEIAAAEPRLMDCVDCHNRPSHIYNSPDYAVDEAIAAGLIDPTLPEIKRVAVEAMAAEYETEADALAAISKSLTEFYQGAYPEIIESQKTALDNAIAAVQKEFSLNIFPEMKTRWQVYPNNIGHSNWPGCMRCHEGGHTNPEGRPITHDCNACHTIMAQGSGDRAMHAQTGDGLEFVHPEDIDEMWKEMGCYECHTGTQP